MRERDEISRDKNLQPKRHKYENEIFFVTRYVHGRKWEIRNFMRDGDPGFLVTFSLKTVFT